MILAYAIPSFRFAFVKVSEKVIVCFVVIELFVKSIKSKVNCLFSVVFGVNKLAPVKVTAAQTLHQNLRSGGVGGKGNLILVTKALNLVYIVKALGVCGIAEEENQVDLVEGDPCANLLCAALIGVHVEGDGKTGGLADQLAGYMSGA